MAPKSKAPRWLTQSFADGADERLTEEHPVNRTTRGAYPGANALCWLAQFDPLERPCAGPLERMHVVHRQRIENAMGALLPDRWELLAQLEAQMGEPDFWSGNYAATVAKAHGELMGAGTLTPLAEVILLAAWDPRIARIGCAYEHHPRFDSKQTPTLIVPRSALPDHVEEWATDWGLESQLEQKFS